MTNHDHADEMDAVRAAEPTVDSHPPAGELTVGVHAGRSGGRRGHRRTAAVVVGALGLLGSGYASGATLGPRPAPAPTAAPAVADAPAPPADVPPVPGIAPQGFAGGEAGTMPSGAVGGVSTAVGYDGFGMYGGQPERTVFRLGELSPSVSTAPSTATAWGFDARSAFSAEYVAILASALGVVGEPVRDEYAWRVFAPDSGAYVTVSLDAQAIVNFHDPTADIPWCEPGQPPDVSGDPACTAVVEPGPGPAVDEAIASLRALLDSIGVPTGDLDFTAFDGGGPGFTSIVATPPGTPVWHNGLGTWSATYTHLGLQSLGGTAAKPVNLGEYDVVDPVEGFERLTDPRFGATLWMDDLWMDVPAAPSPELYVEPTEPPATLTAGARIAWDVSTATITTWELTSAVHYAENGSVLRLPTYRFGDTSGATWEVLAVADHHLAF